MTPRISVLALALAAFLAAAGCSRKPKVLPAPPPPPAQEPAPPDLIEPPATQTKPRPTIPREEVPDVAEPQPAPPPKLPEKTTRPARRRSAPAAPKIEPAEPEPQDNNVKQPQLAVALTEKERAFYESSFNAMVAETRKAIETVSGRDLSEEQRDDLGRIRSLLAQAEQAREPDIRTGARLAQRAARLSRELLKTIR